MKNTTHKIKKKSQWISSTQVEKAEEGISQQAEQQK